MSTGGRTKCTLIPGDGVGPELVYSVQELFKVSWSIFLKPSLYLVHSCLNKVGSTFKRNLANSNNLEEKTATTHSFGAP